MTTELQTEESVWFHSVPRPPAGVLRVRDVTHSTMVLYWDAAPGPVRKYLITYKPQDGEAKEVSLHPLFFSFFLCCCTAFKSSSMKTNKNAGMSTV